ncbi:hypothetical protein QNH39_03215 [Neobacillus novalis]|uniref:Uncharacterized protein n=1 Tax=Neobacillus novalis TaxID=220687 RepID=A0AA95SDM0_9BACI|nr:hypothetical protein [Neobacillus novalis]WHY89172.1 hypothetical protein QNH39_03215 [Neobacillus novalis]
MPIILSASPTFNKERNLLSIRMDENGKKKSGENHQLPAAKWTGYMSTL